jgi:chaperonin GroES
MATATMTKPKAKPKIQIQPLEDRVVILPADEMETKRGRLYIPDTAKEKPTQGEILSAGPGRLDKNGKRLPMEVKVGDTVLYGKYTGTPYQVSGDELIIIKASDILAIIG